MADQPEFFIDRSLGRRAVADALQACGLVVHTMASVYGEQIGQGLTDEIWLRGEEMARRLVENRHRIRLGHLAITMSPAEPHRPAGYPAAGLSHAWLGHRHE
jgi:hypothetical protein